MASCWLEVPEEEPVQTGVGIPDDHALCGLIALGYAARTGPPFPGRFKPRPMPAIKEHFGLPWPSEGSDPLEWDGLERGKTIRIPEPQGPPHDLDEPAGHPGDRRRWPSAPWRLTTLCRPSTTRPSPPGSLDRVPGSSSTRASFPPSRVRETLTSSSWATRSPPSGSRCRSVCLVEVLRASQAGQLRDRRRPHPAPPLAARPRRARRDQALGRLRRGNRHDQTSATRPSPHHLASSGPPGQCPQKAPRLQGPAPLASLPEGVNRDPSQVTTALRPRVPLTPTPGSPNSPTVPCRPLPRQIAGPALLVRLRPARPGDSARLPAPQPQGLPDLGRRHGADALGDDGGEIEISSE